jgi:hypothetical protein
MMSLTPRSLFVGTAVVALLSLTASLWPRSSGVPATPRIAPLASPLRVPSPAADTSGLGNAGLFNPARKATADVTGQAAAQPAAPLPDLTGIIRSASGGGLAMIRKADGSQAIMRLGQSLDGWQLVAVARQSVTLLQGETRQTLKVKRETPPKEAATSSNASSAPAPDAAASTDPAPTEPEKETTRP